MYIYITEEKRAIDKKGTLRMFSNTGERIKIKGNVKYYEYMYKTLTLAHKQYLDARENTISEKNAYRS